MKTLLIALLLVTGAAQASGVISISCQNQTATVDGKKPITVNHATLSSREGVESILKLDGTVSSLPPLEKQGMGYATGASYNNGSKMVVTVVDSPAPNASAMTVSMQDKNGNSLWYMLASGCTTWKE